MFQSTLTRMKSIAKNTKTEAEREVIITNLKEREVNEENLKRNLKEVRAGGVGSVRFLFLKSRINGCLRPFTSYNMYLSI